MKDLKHLYYFERLLDDANNELVRQAKEEGKKCIGSVCYQIPEVLLNLPGTFFCSFKSTKNWIIRDGNVLPYFLSLRIY